MITKTCCTISEFRARSANSVQGVLEGVCAKFADRARNSLIVHVFGQKKSENVQRIPAIIGCEGTPPTGCRPRTPAYRCARLLPRKACCRGLSLHLRETLLHSFVVVGGCRPRNPAYCCARLLLLRACCREQETCQCLTLPIVCALHLPVTNC